MSAARKEGSSDSATPDEGIHRCDTVPPPDGESDPYSAPTKVGPMARALVDKLMADSEVKPPKSGERPLATRKPASSEGPVLVIASPTPIPRLFDADEDEDQEDADAAETESGPRPKQSGETQLMPLNVAKLTAPLATATKRATAPPYAAASDAPLLITPSFAAQLDAHRRSIASPASASGARLVIGACVLLTLGVAALYLFFLAA